jgi:hypothetical protein
MILVVMYLRRVGINGRSYPAALTQISTTIALPAPAAQKSRLEPAATLLGGCVAEQSKY